MKILTAAQMGEVDRLTTEVYNIPSLLLMENAGRAVADELAKAVDRLERKRIMILCGRGNNGGDGLVVARYLALRGAQPEIFLFTDPAGLKGDPLVNWKIVSAMKLPAKVCTAAGDIEAIVQRQATPDVIIDGLFGTGLTRPIGPEFESLIQWVKDASAKAFVVAIDIPSGLYADSPEVPGVVIQARLTVTFTALKLSLVLPPACEFAGKLVVAPIGSPRELMENPDYTLHLIDKEQARKAVPPRPRDSHKGTYGHVFVVAGSRGKSGAALMAGMAALRAGAGLVTLWLPESLQHDVVGKFPELMTEFLPETGEGTTDESALDSVLARLAEAHCLVVGPGISTHPSTRLFVRELIRRATVPVVIDADGLNAFAAEAGTLRNDYGQALVITPHPGEMARLTGLAVAEVQKARLETARSYSHANGCFTILKGAQTIVATPDSRLFINSTGNPGMATGGTGDILAGLVGRFVAGWYRKPGKANSAVLGDYLSSAVYVHGLAGDLAAEEKGMESLVATDLLSVLPVAFKQLTRDSYAGALKA